MQENLKNLENAQREINASLKNVGDQLRTHAETTEKQIKAAGEMSQETRAKVDELLTQQGALQARQTQIEQMVVAADNGQTEKAQTLGQIVLAAEGIERLNASWRGQFSVSAPRSVITNFDSAGNNMGGTTRGPLVTPAQRKIFIRDLLMPGTIETLSYEYPQETGFVNNAAPVEETKVKPYSDITFELQTANVRTIAHLFKASRQALDDQSALQSYIDGRARYGLQLAEDKQLLFGDGTGQNIKGLVPQAQAFAAAFQADAETAIDRLRLAMLQAALAEYAADGIILNPIDWARIELTKDKEGRYIIGNANNGAIPTLWNVPVVETNGMTSGDFLTGAFGANAQILDRMAIEVLISTENADDFEKNLVSIRAEERLAFAVYRPEAFVTGKVVGTP